MTEIRSGSPSDFGTADAFLEMVGVRHLFAGNPLALNSLLAIACDNGRVVGLARGGQARKASGTGAVIPQRFHVNTVIVEREFLGKRIGTGLLERLLIDARDRGFQAAQLWVRTDNASALRVYAKFGFVQTGQTGMGDCSAPIQQMLTDLTRN
jgi:ribosomal protein S18 acetylase RimI-like enzyme